MLLFTISVFYEWCRESGGPQPAASDSQVKTLKSLIRNIGGLPSSPIMGRKPASTTSQTTLLSHSGGGKAKLATTAAEPQHKRSSSKQRLGPGRSSPNVGYNILLLLSHSVFITLHKT